MPKPSEQHDGSWFEILYRGTYDVISINEKDVLSRLASGGGGRVADRDALADEYIAAAARTCSLTGFVSGLGGITTLPIAVPADLGTVATALVRLAQQLAVIYDQEFRTPGGEARMWFLFAGALGIDAVKDAGLKAAVGQAQKYVLKTPFARSVLLQMVRRIGLMLGVRLTHKSIAAMVPVLGGAVGGAMNHALVMEVGGRLKAAFREGRRA